MGKIDTQTALDWIGARGAESRIGRANASLGRKGQRVSRTVQHRLERRNEILLLRGKLQSI